jgi:hypothetical protein
MNLPVHFGWLWLLLLERRLLGVYAIREGIGLRSDALVSALGLLEGMDHFGV